MRSDGAGGFATLTLVAPVNGWPLTVTGVPLAASKLNAPPRRASVPVCPGARSGKTIVEAGSLPSLRITFFNLEASHQAERAPLGAQEIIVFLPPFLDLRHVSLVRSVAHTGHHRQEGEATLVCAQHPNPS